MEASSLVAMTRGLSGLTRTQVAKMAGTSTSTVSRIERAELDPTWSTMTKILTSLGFVPGGTLESVGDAAAVTAFRRIADRSFVAPYSPQADDWVNRWTRAGFVSEGRVVPERFADAALLAGNASQVTARSGAQTFAYTRPWQDIVADFSASGEGYAVSGIESAAGGTAEYGSAWPVIYVESPDRAAEAAGLRPAADGERRVTLLRFDETARQGLWSRSGISWADPVQALVDAYATPGRSADRADSVAPLVHRMIGGPR